MKLIEKKDRDKRYIKNLKPFSLSNVAMSQTFCLKLFQTN